MTANTFPPGLYGITPEWHDADRLRQAVSLACEGGMRVLQWRHKTMQPEQARDVAASLRDICRDAGVLFIVNDDWELALALDADGVHLGKDDATVATVRSRLQSQGHAPFLIGVSCYDSLGLAAAALQDQTDYIAFGALFPSTVKPEAVRAPLSLFRETRTLPGANQATTLVAIGGNNRQNAQLAVQAGADSIAVITGLFGEEDIRGAAAYYASLFEQHRPAS
ncbi:MAG: thiamine phosphate synthase [Advenella sp.]